MKIGVNCFFSLILFLHLSLTYAQASEKTWGELKKAFHERNSAVSEIINSSSDFWEVPDHLKMTIKASIDSINHELASHQWADKLLIKRLEKSNRFLTIQMSQLTNMLENSPGNSNYGNAVRLISIYKNAEEEFKSAVKTFNMKCKHAKRKDLIFHLP